jgi:hypothetical protein
MIVKTDMDRLAASSNGSLLALALRLGRDHPRVPDPTVELFDGAAYLTWRSGVRFYMAFTDYFRRAFMLSDPGPSGSIRLDHVYSEDYAVSRVLDLYADQEEEGQP